MPCLGRVLYASKDARSRSPKPMPKRAPCPRLACSALELVVQQERGAAVKGMERQMAVLQDAYDKQAAELKMTSFAYQNAQRELVTMHRSANNLRRVLKDRDRDLYVADRSYKTLTTQNQFLQRQLENRTNANAGDALADMDTLYAASAMKKQRLTANLNKIREAHLKRMDV
jgi:hypothetical protein